MSPFFHHIAARTLVLTLIAVAGMSFSEARGDILVLANGDHLTGKVIRRAHKKIYFRSDVLGMIVAPANAVVIVPKTLPPPVESLVGLPPPKPAPPPQPPPSPSSSPVKVISKVPVVLTPPVTPWSGKIEFGYDNIASNDVRTVALTFRAQAERTVRADNFLINDRVLYGASGGVATTDEEDGDFRWRHNLSDRLFFQSDTSYDSDKIKLIHYEVEQNAGLGYAIFKTVRQTVDVGAGITGEELDATGVQAGFTYLGNVFQDYTYKINGRFTLSEDTSAQFSPESRGLYGIAPGTVVMATGKQRDYAYKFHATLQGKINNHLSLNLHFEYQYDDAVLVPAARAEQRITTTLGYGF